MPDWVEQAFWLWPSGLHSRMAISPNKVLEGDLVNCWRAFLGASRQAFACMMPRMASRHAPARTASDTIDGGDSKVDFSYCYDAPAWWTIPGARVAPQGGP